MGNNEPDGRQGAVARLSGGALVKVMDLDGAALDPKSSVVTVGVYDGVHVGHQRTLGKVIEAARSMGGSSVVATFDRHPASVLHPDLPMRMLCDLDQRLEHLEELGIDVAAVIPFTLERSLEAAEDFVEKVLVGVLGAGRIIVGEDFHFGRARAGNLELLRETARRFDVAVEGVALEAIGGEVVSSTRLRQLIGEGEMAHAATLLGRPFELRGRVVHGDARGGDELGFPTVNLAPSPELVVPGMGIYAGWYRDRERGPLSAAISVGKRPTFYADGDPLVEAHLLDFEGDLYGADAGISFLERLRNEERFESVESLVAQMGRDVQAAGRLCAAHADEAPRHPIGARH
jgi:riboflavin kinase/FMN adenylyltransferase